MKKIFAVLLALVMILSFAACGEKETKVDPNAKDEGVLTHAQYLAAEEGTEVVIEGFITMKNYAAEYGNVGLMLQDGDGAYFVYRMACTADDNDKLVIGQKIKVTGTKTSWDGLIEIKEATATYEVVDGKYEFDNIDITDKLKAENLSDYQHMKITITGAKVVSEALYKWNGSGTVGDDLYLTVEVGGDQYTLVVESDICGSDTEVYKAVDELKAGDTIDVTGYCYWYSFAIQPWVTGVTKK